MMIVKNLLCTNRRMAEAKGSLRDNHLRTGNGNSIFAKVEWVRHSALCLTFFC